MTGHSVSTVLEILRNNTLENLAEIYSGASGRGLIGSGMLGILNPLTDHEKRPYLLTCDQKLNPTALPKKIRFGYNHLKINLKNKKKNFSSVL